MRRWSGVGTAAARYARGVDAAVGTGVGAAAMGAADGTELGESLTAGTTLLGLRTTEAVAPLPEAPSALETDSNGKQETAIATYIARSAAPPANTLVFARRPRDDSMDPLNQWLRASDYHGRRAAERAPGPAPRRDEGRRVQAGAAVRDIGAH
jgi:hypothetical protein